MDGPHSHRHRSRRHRHHSRRRHHHHHSRSPSSTFSDRSRDAIHSDIGFDHSHHHHHLRSHRSQPRERIITPRPVTERISTPPRRNNNVYRETATGTGLDTKIMKDSSVTADLEDIPSREPRFLLLLLVKDIDCSL